MIFNRILKTLVLISVLAITPSCGEFLRGKPQKNETLEVKQESLSCLKDVSLKVSKFLKSEAKQSEIDSTFECFMQTLTEFQTRVEGKERADAFNADELFQIFDRFIENAEVSREAVDDLLSIKSALLGGTDRQITKEEIGALKSLIETLRVEAKNLLPYAQLFSFPSGKKVFSRSMIQSGFAQLQSSLTLIFNKSKLSQSSYDFADFKQLLTSLKLIDQRHDALVEIAEKLNEVILGGQALATDEDRRRYIGNLTDAMMIYTMQKQGYANLSMNSQQEISDNIEFFIRLVDFLEQTIQFRKTNLISTASLDPMIEKIHAAEIFPIKLTLETAKDFYKVLASRVFGLGLKADVRSFRGFEKFHFDAIRRELAVFLTASQMISKVLSDVPDLKSRELVRYKNTDIATKIKSVNVSELIKVNKTTNVKFHNLVTNSVKIIQNMLSSPQAPIFRFKRIILTRSPEIWSQNWSDLIQSLTVMMLSREMLIGWGENVNLENLTQSHMSDRGTVQWYSEFKNFGIETRSFDPRQENGGPAILASANLFGRFSDSNDKLSFYELIEQNAVLMTAGSRSVESLMSGLERANCSLPEKDVFGYHWQNESCMMQELNKNFSHYFLNLPQLNIYLKRLNTTQFKLFFDAILDIAREDEKNAGSRIETADLRGTVTLLHYIESLFSSFDVDKNGLLSVEEIRRAYNPRFKKFATDYAYSTSKEEVEGFKGKFGYGCYTQDDLIKESFVHLVVKKRVPSKSDFNIMPCTPLGNRALIDIEGNVDRNGLINTLKILKSVLGS